MSRIKSYLLGFITLCSPILSYGQQANKPAVCANAPADGSYKLGGDFNSPAALCLDYETDEAAVSVNGATSTIDPATLYYNFNVRDSDGALVFPGTQTTTHIYTAPGKYWIAQRGKIAGVEYVACKSIEIFATPQMKVKYDNCAAGKISVTILNDPNNTVYEGYRILWGDGTPVEEKPFTSIPANGITVDHTYTSVPTTRPVIQGVYFRGVSICPGEAFVFNISTPVDPRISALEGLNGGSENSVTMKNGDPGTDYDIQVKSGTGTWANTGKIITAPAATPNATAIATVTGLNGSNEYCFRLKKQGACATEVVSNEVCTIKPASQVLSPKEVKVDWETEQQGITRYQVFYRESPTGFNQNSAFIQPPTRTYTFDQMDCSKKYEFWIAGVVGTGTNRIDITSPRFIVEPSSGGKLPGELAGFASVDNNAVRVTIVTVNPKTKYNIYRAEGASTNFQSLTSVALPSYVDNNVEQDKQQYCYKVDYEDACGNRSDLSAPFCTIFLNSARANTVNWTPFSLVSTPNLLQNIQTTQYTVEILDQHGASLGNWSTTVLTEEDVQAALDMYLDNPDMNGRVAFRILAQQAVDYVMPSGVVTLPFYSYSNTYTFITPARIYVPSAFTPNGDTDNEIFKATGRFISQFNMIVYNRWGMPIFESNNMDIGWDGTENGNPAPPGSYSFKIFGVDNAGQRFNKLGSVLLLK